MEEGPLERIFTNIANRVSSAAGRPVTFIIAVSIIVVWGISGPIFGWSDTWQLIINTGTTIVTFLMVFLIQNSQNRDGAAMQAKLDELLRAVEKAREGFVGIEHRTERVPYRRRDRPEIAELTGQSRVPLLIDGDEVIHDSKRIREYLDWRYGDAGG